MHPMTLKIVAMVREFRVAMDQEPDLNRAVELLNEESWEVIEAQREYMDDPSVENMAAFLKEAADHLYVSSGMVEQADALGLTRAGDLPIDYPALNEAIAIVMSAGEVFLDDEMIEEAVKRVHDSNMSKLGPDGKPVRREDGKILKGGNYQPPVLTDLAEVAHRRVSLFNTAFDDDSGASEAA